MQIALVIGSAIATVKDEAIHGRKVDTSGNMTGDPCAAVDPVITGVIDSRELGGEVTYRKQ